MYSLVSGIPESNAPGITTRILDIQYLPVAVSFSYFLYTFIIDGRRSYPGHSRYYDNDRHIFVFDCPVGELWRYIRIAIYVKRIQFVKNIRRPEFAAGSGGSVDMFDQTVTV